VPSDSLRRPVSAAVPILLGAIYVAQCLWFVGTQSLTYDEPTHLLAGTEIWRHGRFARWNDQPPLGRLLLSAPLLFGSWTLEPRTQSLDGDYWTFAIRPSPEQIAWRTRPVNIALGLALAALLWVTARRVFSEAGATFALGLFAFSPALIAHFSLATVDGILTLSVFAVAAALVAWRRHPSWPATVRLGLAIGAALISKFSAVPMAALAFGIMTMSSGIVERTNRLRKVGAAIGVAALVVWAAYLFHVGPVTFRSGDLSGPYARGGRVLVPLSRPFDVTLPLPAPEAVSAFGGVMQHMARGQPSFFLGEISKSGGWPTYFPVVAALKWPPLVWAIAISSAALVIRRAVPAPADLTVIVIFPAVFFGLALLSHSDLGDRYILPVYPFLLLVCAALPGAMGPRAIAIVPIALVAAQALDAVRYAPDYLSYFTPLVNSSASHRLLTDSNLDWGQGLLALRRYEREHPGERLSLAYFGGVDPSDYGIHAWPLAEGARPAGTVVVSATHLSGQYLHDPGAYHWLLEHPRTAILNHSLHVFRVGEGGHP
jgi:dolichyl-phosphate-mannose-protein mannosyltransferase